MLRTHRPVLKWINALKGNEIVPKHRIIASLVGQSKLATIDNIVRRGIILINRCPLCEKDNETHSHLFFCCSYSKLFEVLSVLG